MRYVCGNRKGVNLRIAVLSIVLFFSFAFSATAQALLNIGGAAPDFSVRDLEGKDVSLSQFAGKKAVVILFWSTWSAKSSKAFKRMQDFYEKYKDKGIQVVGINADNEAISGQDVENIKKFIKETGITFPIFTDKALKTFRAYEIMALPSTVIVTEGKISYELPGFPLIGTEDMFDYLLGLAGETPKKKMEVRYKPQHDAIADTSLARKFVGKKKYEMAYPLFQKAIEKDPKYMLAYIELAKLYELEGKDREAEETFKKALAENAESVPVMSEFGYFLTKKGKTKEAVEILDKAAKMNSYTPSHYYLAYALSKSGQAKDALSAFDAALALNPYEPMIYILRGEHYEMKKMPKEASADYRKALELTLKIK